MDSVIPRMMQAIVYDEYGSEEVLQLREIDTPTVADGQVLIAVHAAAINPIDYRIRNGELKGLLPGGFPRVPGYDVAGIVVQTGGSNELRLGDRVMAFLDNIRGGALAEFAVCSASGTAKIPDSMPFEDAAALPLAGSTALQALKEHAHLKEGQSVLINGASGGVGALAVQVAKAYGATVTGIASGSNEQFVRSLGADDFINYEATDFEETGRAWNIVFDAAGKSGFWQSRAVLANDGYYISTEPSIHGAATSILTKLFSKHGEIMLARSDADDLRELIRLYVSGQLKAIIDSVYPLRDAAAAHHQIEHGAVRGKLVVQVTR